MVSLRCHAEEEAKTNIYYGGSGSGHICRKHQEFAKASHCAA
jgi:ribosomal protein L25 (general stress protein Ctc)